MIEGTVVEVEAECEWSTPGAQWAHGSEYWFVIGKIFVPDGVTEEDEDILIDLANDEESGVYWILDDD